jgi:hypothetical protein
MRYDMAAGRTGSTAIDPRAAQRRALPLSPLGGHTSRRGVCPSLASRH